MNPLPKIEVILWDLDGTLLDSISIMKKLAINLAAKNNIEMTVEDFNTISGMGVGKGLEIYLKEKGMSVENFNYKLKYKMAQARTILAMRKVKLFDDAIPTIERLLPDYKMAVISNSPSQYVNMIMDRTKLSKLISLRVARTKGIELKPAPNMLYHAAASIGGYLPSQCVMIGDTHVDIAASKAHGSKSIAVVRHLSRELLQENNPDLIVESLEQITHEEIQKLAGK